MSDNSNSDTEADEQTVAELKKRIGELEERVEQQEAQRGASRRQFLGSLTGIASAGAAGYYLGTQRAQAAPNWGSATGTQGTETTPLSKTVAQTGLYETLGTSSTPVPNAYINNADVTALSAEDATIDKVGARAFLSTSQSVPTGSATQINLDSTTADDWVDAVDLSNNRITIQRSGWYLITGGVVLQGASDGTRMTSILQVNDSTISEAPDHAAKGSAIIGGQATDTRILSSGDHVTLSAFHDEGAPLNTEDDERNVYLSVFGGF